MQATEKRIAALETKTLNEHGVFVVQHGETIEDAMARVNLSETQRLRGVLLVPAKDDDDCHHTLNAWRGYQHKSNSGTEQTEVKQNASN